VPNQSDPTSSAGTCTSHPLPSRGAAVAGSSSLPCYGGGGAGRQACLESVRSLWRRRALSSCPVEAPLLRDKLLADLSRTDPRCQWSRRWELWIISHGIQTTSTDTERRWAISRSLISVGRAQCQTEIMRGSTANCSHSFPYLAWQRAQPPPSDESVRIGYVILDGGGYFRLHTVIVLAQKTWRDWAVHTNRPEKKQKCRSPNRPIAKAMPRLRRPLPSSARQAGDRQK
jgi:hypothetical protein